MSDIGDLYKIKLKNKNNEIPDIMTEIRSGKQIYNGELEAEDERMEMEEMERLQEEEMRRAEQMVVNEKFVMDENEETNDELHSQKEKTQETKKETNDDGLLYRISKFFLFICVGFVSILLFNCGTTLKIIENNFQYLVNEVIDDLGHTTYVHSYLSTFVRGLLTTVVLGIYYLFS